MKYRIGELVRIITHGENNGRECEILDYRYDEYRMVQYKLKFLDDNSIGYEYEKLLISPYESVICLKNYDCFKRGQIHNGKINSDDTWTIKYKYNFINAPRNIFCRAKDYNVNLVSIKCKNNKNNKALKVGKIYHGRFSERDGGSWLISELNDIPFYNTYFTVVIDSENEYNNLNATDAYEHIKISKNDYDCFVELMKLKNINFIRDM